MSKKYSRNSNTECVVCGTSIYRRPNEIRRGRVFCSQLCYGKALTKEKPCVVCGTLMRTGLNKKTCSRACANKNRAGIKYTGSRLSDKVVTVRRLKVRLFSIRGAQCERCGYSKKEVLQVHHKDRNPTHNDLTNLELICPNCHYEEHYLEKSWLNDTLQH